jgi:hypothetical protein
MGTRGGRGDCRCAILLVLVVVGSAADTFGTCGTALANQRQSEAIRGNQRQSEAIRGD